jgi:tetratricopeptide (TPR) repeat protein
VWRVPNRNLEFTGRAALLAEIRRRLRGGDRAVVHALNGYSGIGKTQLAIEYAYRYAAEYDLVWWVDSENPELIAEQLAVLAARVGAASSAVAVPEAVRSLGEYLRGYRRSLLVFDNVVDPDDIVGLLPAGAGDVLITSRTAAWAKTASVIDVDVFDPAESVGLLRRLVPRIRDSDAAELAERLGHLPLALSQAAGVLAERNLQVEQYLRLLEGQEGGQNPVEAAVRLSLGQLDPAATDLVRVCALLAPELIPLDLVASAVDLLPTALARAVAETPASHRGPAGDAGGGGLHRCIQVCSRLGLLRVSGSGLVMHRLTQSVISTGLDPGQFRRYRTVVEAMIAHAHLDDGNNPRYWPLWQTLMPHLLRLEPGSSRNPYLRRMANDAVVYLLARGDVTSARATATALHQQLRREWGPRHRNTLQAAHNLATCYGELGEHDRARHLDEQTLHVRREVFGEDDPDTLESKSGFALDLHQLGEFDRARLLDEEVFQARSRLLGEDHPDTQTSANNLGNDWRELGRLDEARRLHQHCHEIYLRELGERNPATLTAAANLAEDLVRLGELDAAAALHEQTLAAREQVLGRDHPHTLGSARQVAQVRGLLARRSPP